jgi:hypothetical protein
MDQYTNHVDGEIYIPAPWKPLGKDDWMASSTTNSVVTKEPTPVPLETLTQYAFGHADGSIGEERYTREDTALQELRYARSELKGFGIPEEYHPVLMERTVETVASSWRIRSE